MFRKLRANNMKKKLLLLIIPFILLGFWLYEVKALDSGALSPGTVVDDNATGTIEWINPMNATTSDNVYATFTSPIDATSHYLKATNFGFSIPSGATINGILVEIERIVPTGGTGQVNDSEIKIVKSNGTIGDTNKSTGATWSATESYISFGGSSDLWGETWTAADINDSDFGVVLSATISNQFVASYGRVDHIRITVYFQEAASESAKFQVKSGTLEIKSGNLMIQ